MLIKNINLHIRRFEFKYLVSERDLDKIRKSISNFVTLDPYAKLQKREYYQVSSLYLDDINLSSYYEKLAGLKYRKKFRIRVYDEFVKDDTRAYLEIKKRDETIIFKDRVALNVQTARDVLENGRYQDLPSLAENDNEFVGQFLSKRLMPTVLLSYKREAYLDERNSNFRLTLDQDIHAKRAFGIDFDVENTNRISKGFAVVEAKFNHIMPAWFGMIIKLHNLSRVAFSKYCFSLESCGIVSKTELPFFEPWI